MNRGLSSLDIREKIKNDSIDDIEILWNIRDELFNLQSTLGPIEATAKLTGTFGKEYDVSSHDIYCIIKGIVEVLDETLDESS